MDSFDFHPEKPELAEQAPKGGLSLTFFSLVLFVLIFLLFFGDEINFIVYLVIVLLIHELGHFLAMKAFKYKNVRMLFVPLMGAFVQGTKSNYSQRQSFIVTAAGPLPGILIGTILVVYGAENRAEWMLTVGILFLLLNVINLLPLDPLDGGQLFKLFMKKKHELFLMIFAFLSSLAMIGVGWFMGSYVLMIFGFFMGFRVRAMQKKYEIHKELNDEGVDYATTYKSLSNEAYAKIKRVVIEYTPALQKYMDQVSADDIDPVLASQVNSVLVAPLKKDTSFIFRVLLLLLWIASFAVPIILFMNIDIQWYLPEITSLN
ncbi:MAG: site-2 protease family protein [Fluviicola sp.]|nr:site-2 protease family protein [Fluviicola sp.]